MLKLIPLVIFPLSFFLIFLGVKNLTGNFALNKKNISQNAIKEIENFDKDSEKIERKVITESEQNYINIKPSPINKDEKLINNNEKEKMAIELKTVKESFDKNKLPITPEKTKNNSKKNQKKVDNFKIVPEDKNNYLIQFGAFSKKNNAEDLKNSIIEKLNSKFPDFQINLDFDEKKKLYKLISQTNDFNKAKKVCSFSKEIKINCLFKKQ